MTYKTKIHCGNTSWWSTISSEILTKEELKQALTDYKAGQGSSMVDMEVQGTLAVIEQCKIPQTIGTERCDVGFIVITDIEWQG